MSAARRNDDLEVAAARSLNRGTLALGAPAVGLLRGHAVDNCYRKVHLCCFDVSSALWCDCHHGADDDDA